MGTTGLDNLTLTGNLVVTGTATIPGVLPVDDDLEIDGALNVTGAITGEAGLELTGGTLQLATGLDAANIDAKGQEAIRIAIAGTVAAGADKARALSGISGTILLPRAHAGTAPVGAAMIIDIHKNGVTIFTTQGNRPTIADGAQASSFVAPDVVNLAAVDILTIDIDQVGVGTAGADITIVIPVKHGLVD